MKTLPEQARELTAAVHRASARFPEEALSAQLRATCAAFERAAASLDGGVAHGKLAATASLLLLSRDLCYLPAAAWPALRRLVEELGKTLRARALPRRTGPGSRSSLKKRA